MPDIAAPTLTDAERALIPALWPDAEGAAPGTAFLDWQRATLAAEIERRAAIKASAEAQATVGEAVQAVRDEFPTVFGE